MQILAAQRCAPDRRCSCCENPEWFSIAAADAAAAASGVEALAEAAEAQAAVEAAVAAAAGDAFRRQMRRAQSRRD